MKQALFFFIAIIVLTLLPAHAEALTPTPTTNVTSSPSPTTKETLNDKINEQINQLKTKIASRVSELNLVEKRGMIGTVSEVVANKITLTDVAGKTRFVDVDEITKFSSASNKSFGLSDLTKGTKITVLGLYNKQSKRILARFIYTTVDPTVLHGAISDLDKKNFFVTMTTPDQKQTKIDVQTSTKIFGYDTTDGLAKLGFSKLAIGDRIAVIGYPDKKDATLLVASRLIDLSILPRNPKIIVSQAEPTESTKTSITPTPTITKKITPTKAY